MIYIGIAAGIFLLEYRIKGYIEKNGKETETVSKLGGLLQIKKYHNKGAFLNFMERNEKLLKVISILFTFGLTVLFIITLGKKGSSLLKTGLALLLGGAYSNTYDRMHRKYVVDYFSIHISKGPFKKLQHVVFNISDFCIMIGALLFVLASAAE